jgi:hypothetical protein
MKASTNHLKKNGPLGSDKDLQRLRTLGASYNTVATYFIGIILVSVSGMIQHKRIGEGLIYDTGFAASAQS